MKGLQTISSSTEDIDIDDSASDYNNNNNTSRSRTGSFLSTVRSGDDDGASSVRALSSHGDYPLLEKKKKTYYQNVAGNKEIAKLVGSMSTIINSQKKEITGAFSHYEVYSDVWMKDKDALIGRFLDDNPTLDEFEQQIIVYKEIGERLDGEEEKMHVGSICLLTGSFHCCFFYNVDLLDLL